MPRGVGLVCHFTYILVRDWSLIMGRGATKREGEHVKFNPDEKGGGCSKMF